MDQSGAAGGQAGTAKRGARRWSFGAIAFDERAMKLFVGTREVHLELKPLEVLRYLLEHAGAAVSKEDLIGAMWPGRIISDSALTSTISKLREALGEDGESLETVHGFGYRLEADVRQSASAGIPPDGEQAATVQPPSPPDPSSFAVVPKRPRNHRIAAATLGFALLLVWMGAHWRSLSTTSSVELAPIAILPCDNLSGDAGLDLLAEGIAEEISQRLSRVHDLAIIGRASSRAVKGEALNPRAVSERLNAGHVLSCSLRRISSRLRLTTQLVAGRTGIEEWSSVFDYEPDGTADTVGEVAVSVADAVLPRLLGPERALLVQHNTGNRRALEAYLRGLHELDLYTGESMKRSVELFDEAIQLDPAFAEAFVALGYAVSDLSDFDPDQAARTKERMMAAAQKALALDPSLAEAHALLGVTLVNYTGDFGRARAELYRAVELNPNSPRVNSMMTYYYIVVGPFEKAIPFARKGVRLDPLNTLSHVFLLRADLESRAYRQCELDADAALALHPAQWDIHWRQGQCLLAEGKAAEGLAAIRRAVDLVHEAPVFARASLAYALAANGKRDEAAALTHKIQEELDALYVPDNWIYVAYAGLGDKEHVLYSLKTDFDRGSGEPYQALHQFWFDSMRQDPRFVTLLRAHGLKPDGTLLDLPQ